MQKKIRIPKFLQKNKLKTKKAIQHNERPKIKQKHVIKLKRMFLNQKRKFAN